MKKFFIFIITTLLFISGITTSFADDTITEEEFNNLKNNGVYSEDITYKDFINSLNAYEDESNILKSPRYVNNNAFRPRKGDIVTTGASNTASNGVIGHAGIFIDNNNILHIAGSNTNKITTLTWSQWKDRYRYRHSNRVFRVPNSTIANQAANWVIRNYKGKSPGYGISSNWRSTSPTYCSKIVWQGYYFGTGSAPVMKKPIEPFIIHPKLMASYFNRGYAPIAVYYK